MADNQTIRSNDSVLAGNFLRVYRSIHLIRGLCDVMPKTTALFLLNLLDILSRKDTLTCDIQGTTYFFCSTETLQNSPVSLGWSCNQQVRHLRTLASKKLGILTYARAGKPSTRIIHIDMDRMLELLLSIQDTSP